MTKKTQPKHTPELIIFDCDGVLVDSEVISIAILSELIAEAGGNFTEQQVYEALLGRQVRKARQSILTVLGVDLPNLDVSHFNQILYQRLAKELRPIPSIHQLLEALNMPVCVASSSNAERLALSLDLTHLAPFFGDNVFSADLVENGKPAPDLFLLAAERMGVMPQNCLVIEDSPAGIKAAQSAGMRVVGFTGGSHAVPAGLSARLQEENPHAIINTITDVQSIISHQRPQIS